MADLMTDRDDLHLAWPLAHFPFDHDQWREKLNPELGHKSFLVQHDSKIIGNANLLRTDESGVYRVAFVYLRPEYRNQGLGTQVVSLLEQHAIDQLPATKLELGVRDYNPSALRCYIKCGFREMSREDTLIWMGKSR